MIKVYSDGARILLDYLQASFRRDPAAADLLSLLWQERSFKAWVEAYASWIENLEPGLRSLFENPNKIPDTQPPVFWQLISRGFTQAAPPQANDRCRRVLDALEKADFAASESAAYTYLPPDTPLDIEIYPTVDGFNGGMFRDRQVFLSVLDFKDDEIPSVLAGQIGFGAHEFHHIGAAHWFDRNSRLLNMDSKNAGGRLLVRMIKHLVSEGMANAFLSPQVLQPEPGDSPQAGEYNARLFELQAGWPDAAIEKIEWLVEETLSASSQEDVVKIEAAFEDFALDLSGIGLPEGHFVSGKMIQHMAEVLPLEKIIDLVVSPWRLFELYNASSTGSGHNFSEDLVERIGRLFR